MGRRRASRWRAALGVIPAASLVGLNGLACAPESPRNALLVVVDTVRADHLGLYGHDRPTSPELERWAPRAAVFEQALATSPWTIPSFASIYTGQLPSRHGAGLVGPSGSLKRLSRLDDGVRTLAEILFEHGFATAALINNPFLHPKGGLARGFERYDYEPGSNREIRRADVMVDRALRWLDEPRERPFFLVLHLFDPHLNYDPPPSVRGRFTSGYQGRLRLPVVDLGGIPKRSGARSEAGRAFITGAYDEELLFVDSQLGRLLDGLEARGRLGDSLVMLVADHGEEFFDHGGFEHGHSVFQELLRVPVVVWGPGVRPARIDAAVSIADVFPTVLEALGIPAEPGVAGRSLWGLLGGGAAPPERSLVAEALLHKRERKALIRWPHKLVFEPSNGRIQLFDLVTDPAETRDLAGSSPELGQELLAELEATLEAASRERAARREAAFPAAIEERLRGLGYLDAEGS